MVASDMAMMKVAGLYRVGGRLAGVISATRPLA